MSHQLLIPTTNLGKLHEIKTYFKDLPLQIIGLSDLPHAPNQLYQIPETGTTFKQNALHKARTAARLTNLLTLADDSGLQVKALNDRPGVLSARYGTTDQLRISKLLKELKNIPQSERSAKFVCVMCLYDPNTGQAQCATGIASGYITPKPYGTQGFGYDPIFYSKILNKTFAQASTHEKNATSHRAQALLKMLPILTQHIQSLPH